MIFIRSGLLYSCFLFSLAGCFSDNLDESSHTDIDGIADNSSPINKITPKSRIFAVGDSLTSGAYGFQWRTSLSEVTNLQVINKGVGGQTSKQISARMGVRPVYISPYVSEISETGVFGLAIPGVHPLTSQGLNYLEGRINSVPGMLYRRRDDGSYYFDVAELLQPVAVKEGDLFKPTALDIAANDIAVIWVGRNNAHELDTVLLDVLRIYNLFAKVTSRIIVLSVINGEAEYTGTTSHSSITAINEQLKFEFGDSYLDIRQVLIESYDPNESQSVIDYEKGTTPSSLREDNVHLNAAGNQIVAYTLYSHMLDHGWL
ncbi:MAG: hypothetical protein KUG82_18185 [Pseudomonadales bacterium]|nr:hypothetical protein [Pseudomonadales bacterium]